MLKLQPDSLFLVSALGVLDGLAVVVAGGFLGAWIDRCVIIVSCTESAKLLSVTGQCLQNEIPGTVKRCTAPVCRF